MIFAELKEYLQISTQKLLISYAEVTYIIRRSYLYHTQKLLISYAEVTFIRRSYLYHTQKLLIPYAEVNYIIRRSYLYHQQKLLYIIRRSYFISYAEVTYIISRSYFHAQKLLFLFYDLSLILNRSSHRRFSKQKGILTNFVKFTGKCLCQSFFFNKVAGLSCFPVNFAKFLRTTFVTEHLRTTASVCTDVC